MKHIFYLCCSGVRHDVVVCGVAVCGAIDFNARSTSFKRCILTRSATSKPWLIAAERIPDKHDLIVVYLQLLRAVLLAQFISASSLRGNGLRLAVVQYCM